MKNNKRQIVKDNGKSNLNESHMLFENLDKEHLLTADELAERLHIAVKTVRKWRYEEVLPPESMVKLHRSVRFRWEKVLEWLIAKR